MKLTPCRSASREDGPGAHGDGEHEPSGIVQAYTVLSAESVTDEHPGRPYFERRYEVLRRTVTDAFETLYRQEGVTDTASIAAASASILAVMDGLQLQWLHH